MWCAEASAGAGAGGGWRCVARSGLPAGAASPAFAPADLAAAARLLDHAPSNTVYVEACSGGHGWRVAGAGRAGGGALAAAAARLAPHAPAASAALCLAPPADAGAAHSAGAGGGGALRLCVVVARALAPHEELLLWPDAALLALAGLAPLHPTSIRGSAEYRCLSCAARFEQPNPLKMHVFLRCAAPRAPAFLRALAAALAPLPAPAPAPAGHPCAYCGRVYSRRYGLKIHVRTHTGERPLRCERCARRFADPSNLNKHRRLHLPRPSPPRHSPRAPLTGG